MEWDAAAKYMPTRVIYDELLTDISVYIDNDNQILLKKYELDYDYSEAFKRCRLASITEYGIDGTSLPPVTFTHSKESGGPEDLPGSPDDNPADDTADHDRREASPYFIDPDPPEHYPYPVISNPGVRCVVSRIKVNDGFGENGSTSSTSYRYYNPRIRMGTLFVQEDSIL